MTQQTATRSAPSRPLSSDLIELLGSMRFAISLLVFLCVASMIGTVLAQNRPASSYVDQFGPFWFEVFDKFALWHVYNSPWFLLIMGFLVLSTSVCLARNAPRMLREARSFREHVRADSLRAFPHRVEAARAEAPARTAQALRGLLEDAGYAVRERRDGESVMLAAKKGGANRLGYVCAHAALVIICLGGLLDSELAVRLQVLAGKRPVTENLPIAEVPASGRLGLGNPSFRASVLVPEGGQAGSAVVMVGDGALVQPLPFVLRLKKFLVDYYSTGMPSRFASEVEVFDPDTGKTFDATIEVNEPLRYKGVTVYQSSFDDGGSSVRLTGYPLAGPDATTFQVDGTVGQSSRITAAGAGGPQRALRLDVTALRPINVQDLSGGVPGPRDLTLGEHVASVAGSAAGRKNENLRNIGPSIEYRLVDEAGQAHEFQNYMLPVTVDGVQVFLAGVRANAGEPYRYLRIPADQEGSVAEFMRLRAALADPALRQEAARRFAARNTQATGGDPAPLQTAAERALDTFSRGGLQAIADFLQANTPPAELERAADVVVRLLGAGVAELRDLARERAGVAPLPETAQEEAAQWSRLAVAALSDLTLYPAPVFLALGDFRQVQASVFQVSRTPGKNAVYLGCLLLIAGIFAMFYIRDRRVWAWVQPAAAGGSAVLAAMTSQRRTLDFEHEFERLREAIRAQERA